MYYKVTAKYKTDEDNTTFEFIADTEDIQHIYLAAEDEGEEILGIRKPRARSLLDVNEELSVEYNVKFTA